MVVVVASAAAREAFLEASLELGDDLDATLEVLGMVQPGGADDEVDDEDYSDVESEASGASGAGDGEGKSSHK